MENNYVSKKYSMQVYPIIQSIHGESCDVEGAFILLTHLFRFILKVMYTFAEKKDLFFLTLAFLLLVTYIQKVFS